MSDPVHADALALLGSWVGPTPVQATLRTLYLAHLDAHPDGVRRHCRPDHLTASTLVLDESGARVLLTLHAKAQAWFQLGGHVEDGDLSLAAAAAREAAEESGIEGLLLDPVPVQLDVHPVPFCRAPGAGGPVDGAARHLDVRFVAVAPAGARSRISAESADLRWWPADDLPSREPSLRELVDVGRLRLGVGAG